MLYGQESTTGDIRGIVFDQSGAPIAGVALRFVEQETGIIVNAVASGDGSYTFLSVRPGAQKLTVSANGFAPTEIRRLVVLVGRTTFQNIVLKPAEVVEV